MALGTGRRWFLGTTPVLESFRREGVGGSFRMLHIYYSTCVHLMFKWTEFWQRRRVAVTHVWRSWGRCWAFSLPTSGFTWIILVTAPFPACSSHAAAIQPLIWHRLTLFYGICWIIWTMCQKIRRIRHRAWLIHTTQVWFDTSGHGVWYGLTLKGWLFEIMCKPQNIYACMWVVLI